MKTIDFSQLDNPAWYALSTTQAQWAHNYEHLKLYHQDICPFGAGNGKSNFEQIPLDIIAAEQHFFIIGERPSLPPSFVLEKGLVCLQMVCETSPSTKISDTIVTLTDQQVEPLHQLVNLVQPGYFKAQTHILGNYWGIIKDDQLVAAAGERMQFRNFTEISAVVTHPDYCRQGLAKQLVSHAVFQNLAQGKIPFLHVLESNLGAIQLYEKLSFYTRRKMTFWLIKRLQ